MDIDSSNTAIFGVLAGSISFFAYLYYYISICNGSTKPNRATWWILFLIGSLIAVSYYKGGARDTIWFALSYVIGPLIAALLSLKYGEGKWSRVDKICLTGAIVSIPFWFIAPPLTVLIINISVDFLGMIPTVWKSYRRPESENRWSWALTLLSSMLNIMAIEAWEFEISIYPVYMLGINGLVTTLLFKKTVGRKISKALK